MSGHFVPDAKPTLTLLGVASLLAAGLVVAGSGASCSQPRTREASSPTKQSNAAASSSSDRSSGDSPDAGSSTPDGGTQETCDNGTDDDGDGATDCADSDCDLDDVCDLEWVELEATKSRRGPHCARSSSGVIYCWGGGFSRPYRIEAPSSFASFELAADGGVAWTSGGRRWTWTFPDPPPLSSGRATEVDVTAEESSVTHDFVPEQLVGRTACVLEGGTIRCASGDEGRATADWFDPSGSDWVDFSATTRRAPYACGVESDGRLRCWTARNERTVDIHPKRADETWKRVATGGERVCGRTAEGTVYCWSLSDLRKSESTGKGETGSTARRTVPPVEAGVSFTSLSVSSRSTCARSKQGSLYCWGRVAVDLSDPNNWQSDKNGGSPRPADSRKPVEVPGELEAEHFEVGRDHACATDSEGTLSCWGHNPGGEVGRTAKRLVWPKPRSSPRRQVPFQTEHIASFDPRSECIVGEEGEFACDGGREIGSELFNQRALEAVSEKRRKRAIDRATVVDYDVRALRIGPTQLCLLDDAANLRCGGDNVAAQIGLGRDSPHVLPPKRLAIEGGVRRFDLSIGHGCAVSEGGALHCWGANRFGEVGDGTEEVAWVPTHLQSDRTFVEVTTGSRHSCALTRDGEALCWGDNGDGQLGNGTTENASEPTSVSGSHKFETLVAEARTTCGIDAEGRLFCWGRTPLDEENWLEPRRIGEKGGYRAVAASFDGICALDDERALVCAGSAFGPTWQTVFDRDPLASVTPNPYGFCIIDDEGASSCFSSLRTGHNLHIVSYVPEPRAIEFPGGED